MSTWFSCAYARLFCMCQFKYRNSGMCLPYLHVTLNNTHIPSVKTSVPLSVPLSLPVILSSFHFLSFRLNSISSSSVVSKGQSQKNQYLTSSSFHFHHSRPSSFTFLFNSFLISDVPSSSLHPPHFTTHREAVSEGILIYNHEIYFFFLCFQCLIYFFMYVNKSVAYWWNKHF